MSEEEDIWKTERRIAKYVENKINPYFLKFIAEFSELIGFIRKHSLAIGMATAITLTVSGVLFLCLCETYLMNEGAYWYEWQKEITRAYGYLGGPLFLAGLIFATAGFVFISYYGISCREPAKGIAYGITLAVIGSISLIIRQNPFLRDIPAHIDSAGNFVNTTTYHGEVRFYLLVTGILFLAIGLATTIRFLIKRATGNQ